MSMRSSVPLNLPMLLVPYVTRWGIEKCEKDRCRPTQQRTPVVRKARVERVCASGSTTS